MARLSRAPEPRLAAWGFLLNGAWEAAQTPLYADAGREVEYLVWTRLHCTAGDVLILLGSFALTSAAFRSRSWMSAGSVRPRLVFVALGLAYAVASEHFNVHWVGSWSYRPAMPVVLGIGLAPLVQWLLVPVILLRLLRRPPKDRR